MVGQQLPTTVPTPARLSSSGGVDAQPAKAKATGTATVCFALIARSPSGLWAHGPGRLPPTRSISPLNSRSHPRALRLDDLGGEAIGPGSSLGFVDTRFAHRVCAS